MAHFVPVVCIGVGTTFRCIAGGSRKCFGVSRFTYTRHRNIEVRSQKPELRRKKSPACTQRFRNEGGRVLDHPSIAPTSWHFSTNLACSGFSKHPQSHAKIEPRFSFSILAIRVGQLAHKMRFVSTFCPGLAQICTNRSR